MISVENLTKRYFTKTAIEGMSFRVEKGEILGFLGPNGAGKTTTMRIITGYMPSTDGTVKVDGFDVADQPLEVRRRIGYLPENPPLYTEMTVKGYLQFVAKLKGVTGARVQDDVNRAMDKVNITDVQDRIIAKLSKGYKQRVGIAQALLNDPPVLILDEPTIGLDPKQIQEVRELIKSLAGNHTVVLSTHILPEVEQTCHRVIIIDRGKIVAVDTPQNLRSQIQAAPESLSRLRALRRMFSPPLRRCPESRRSVSFLRRSRKAVFTSMWRAAKTFAANLRGPLSRLAGDYWNCSLKK